MVFLKRYKLFCNIALLLLVSLFFYKPLLESGVGFGLRAYFAVKKGWHFNYRSVVLQDGALVFEGWILKDPLHFEAKSEKAVFSYKKKHLEIMSPEIFLKKSDFSPSSKVSSYPNWTFSVRNGAVSGENIPSFLLEAKKDFPDEIATVFLDFQERGKLTIELFRQPLGKLAHLQCEDLDPICFQEWLSGGWEGKVCGEAHFRQEGGVWKEGSCNLEVHSLKRADLLENVSAFLEWEGSIEEPSRGRFYLNLEEAALQGRNGRIEKLSGRFHFLHSLGVKWDFKGLGNFEEGSFPIVSLGKGFFQEESRDWIEAELFCKEARFSLHGERKEDWLWEALLEGVSAKELRFFQSFGTLFEERLEGVEIKSGRLDLKANGTGLLENWSCFYTLRDLDAKWAPFSVALKESTGEYSTFLNKGKISLQKGAFYRGEECAFSDVKGQLELDDLSFTSQWRGQGFGFTILSDLQGKVEDFQAKVSLEGKENGELFFTAGFDQEKLFFFLEKGQLGTFDFWGCGRVESDGALFARVDRFKGPLEVLSPIAALPLSMQGNIESRGEGFSCSWREGLFDWSLEGVLEEVSVPFSWGKCEHLSADIKISPSSLMLIGARGHFLLSGVDLPFYLPFFENCGAFDFRLQGPYLDYARLEGRMSEKEIEVDLEKSQILGEKIHFAKAFLEEGKLAAFQLEWDVSLAPFFQLFSEIKAFESPLPSISGKSKVCLQYEKEGGAELEWEGSFSWAEEEYPFRLFAHQEEEKWDLEHVGIGKMALFAEIMKEEGESFLIKGRSGQEEDFSFAFEGKWDLGKKLDLRLEEVSLQLEKVEALIEKMGLSLFQGVNGMLEGAGHLSYQGQWEADFDFTPSPLATDFFTLENRGPIQAHYSSAEGIVFRGLNLSAKKKGDHSFWMESKVELLAFDPIRSFWRLNRLEMHLPKKALTSLSLPFLIEGDEGSFIDLAMDVECASDFSRLQGQLKEGFIPYNRELYHLQNGNFTYEKDHLEADFFYLHEGRPLQVFTSIYRGDTLYGKVGFQEPLDASLGKLPLFLEGKLSLNGDLVLSSIEGNFGGIEANFHRENEEDLIGSARFDCQRLSSWVFPSLREVFSNLKMGAGYELKGRLKVKPESGFAFDGLLSGKNFGLFGYELRTLLGRIEYRPDRLSIYDFKISDDAGIMKVDEILVEQKGHNPWTIAMPSLIISELRPSLLHRAGEQGSKEASPLVVREMKLSGFTGLLEESRTYCAKGTLNFINSYRRESTVFDLAPDMLSRIAGLDLEILIPACGTLEYELKEGLFHLTELKDSYSEGKRAQFFLDFDEAVPTVDLDGNLQIFIKMKQFVLFKFTESFLISIDGKLEDPKFHLQRKRRFLGL